MLKRIAVISLPILAVVAGLVALGALIAFSDWDDSESHTVGIVKDGPAEGVYIDGEYVNDFDEFYDIVDSWSAYDDVTVYEVQ